MYLTNYLEQLSPSILNKIMEEHGRDNETTKPNELVKIIQDMMRYENLSTTYQQLTKIEREVLSYFIIQIPTQPFFYRRLDRFSGSMSRDEFEYGLTKLRRKGIVFALRRSWGELVYSIPDDLFLAWHKFFLKKAFSYLNRFADSDVKEKIEIDTFLEDDLYAFLSYIEFEEIPITQKGTIHKRHISKISEDIRLDEKKMTYFSSRKWKNETEYPKKIALLLEIVQHLGLVEQFDQASTTKRATLWHHMENNKRREYLEFIIRVLFKSSDIIYQHLFLMLFHLKEETWFSFHEVLTYIAKELKRTVDVEMEQRAYNEALLPLSAFGWLEFGYDKENRVLFKWKHPDRETMQEIYVQANFEILVPSNFPYHLRLQIEQFTKLLSKDRMIKYLITKESFYKGLEKGSTTEEFLELLHTFSAIPVSENVEKTIKGWGEKYGALTFMDVRIMQCASTRIAEEIKAHPELKKWVIGEITPEHLIIKREKYEELIQLLRQIEHFPKKEIWFGKSEDQIEESDEEDFTIFKNKEFYVENAFPPLTHF